MKEYNIDMFHYVIVTSFLKFFILIQDDILSGPGDG